MKTTPPPLYNHYVIITSTVTVAQILLQYCSASPNTITTIRDFAKLLGNRRHPANGIVTISEQYYIVYAVDVTDTGILTAVAIKTGSTDLAKFVFDDTALFLDSVIKIS